MLLETLLALIAAATACFYQIGAIFPTAHKPVDPDVAKLDSTFQSVLSTALGLVLESENVLRDRDMLFWWRFADNFGKSIPLTCSMRCHCLASCCRAQYGV